MSILISTRNVNTEENHTCPHTGHSDVFHGLSSSVSQGKFFYHHESGPFLTNHRHLRMFKKLWNPKFYYRVHKSPPLLPTLSQTNTVHITKPYLPKIHFNIIPHQLLVLPSSSCHQSFPPTSDKHSYSRHTCYMSCLSHPSWLDHLNYTDNEYNLCSPSLCSFMQPPVTPSRFSSAPCSPSPSVYVPPLMSETNLHQY
jgi:hypothetical protein